MASAASPDGATAGLVSRPAARVLVDEGPRRIREVAGWGARFDREGGRYLGDGSECFVGACTPPPPGACCLPGGGCVEVMREHCDREGGRFLGPGISDNGRGLAALVAIAAALRAGGIPLARPLLFAATVGEEGAGNLRGVRHLLGDGGSERGVV